MPYGMRITNPLTGSVQFDENTRNHILVRSGPSDATLGSAPGPVLSIEMESGYSRLALPVASSGDDLPLRFVGQGVRAGLNRQQVPFIAVNSGAGSTPNIYDFNFPETIPAPTSKWGWMIKNAAGKLVYHSDLKPLRIVDVLSGSDYSASPPDKTYPAGRDYAFLPLVNSGTYSFQQVRSGGTSYQYRGATVLMYQLDGTRLTASESYIGRVVLGPITGGFNQGPFYRSGKQWSVMVIDVTHY